MHSTTGGIKPKPPPKPNWTEEFRDENLRPTCINIVTAEQQDKSIMLYDAELYEGMDDRDNFPLKTPETLHSSTYMNIADISAYINLCQQQNEKQNN